MALLVRAGLAPPGASTSAAAAEQLRSDATGVQAVQPPRASSKKLKSSLSLGDKRDRDSSESDIPALSTSEEEDDDGEVFPRP